ncbi:alpha-(1,3)-fucosyltransferase 7-like [Clytia hemisphaerica]
MAAHNSLWKFLLVIVLIAVLVFTYKYQGSSRFTAENRVKSEAVSTKEKNKLVKGTKLKKSKIKNQQRQKMKSSRKKNSKRPSTSEIPSWFRTTKKSNLSVSKSITSKIGKKDWDKVRQLIKSKRKKIILSYTEVFEDPYWYDVPRFAPLTELDGSLCPFNHCQVVYDQKKYISKADAVLFHADDLPSAAHLKVIRRLKSKPTQTWIWMTSQSPLYFDHQISFEAYKEIFNWTGTYRRDSEIFAPYRVIKPLLPSDKRPDPKKNYAKGKDKMIIALISNHCDSYRIKLIRALKQFIDIDLYGRCKNNVNPELKGDCPLNSKECIQLQSRYKFTLSLENAYCKDYVTEKFYLNGLSRGNVPIVMNRATMSDPEVAPPGSYINILDFENLKMLADFLKKLAQNDQEYNKFHEWRQKYKIGSKNRMCTTCEALWKRDMLRKNEKRVKNIDKFWAFDTNCLSHTQKMFAKYLN